MKHLTTNVDNMEIFYREAGPAKAPVLLLPHGYPGSSFVHRHLMAALADEFRLVAPDLPGFGYSGTPPREEFGYTFDAYADFLIAFTRQLDLPDYVLWLHDHGSQFGLRLAMQDPARVTGLIIANGDIYEDQFGPEYDKLVEMWANPGPEFRQTMEEHVSLEGFPDEFAGELPPELEARVSPDLWTLHWALMNTPERRANLITLLEDQPSTLHWFPREQQWLHEQQPETHICLGHTRRLHARKGCPRLPTRPPDAELHLFDGAHWLLETHLEDVIPLVRTFLRRVHAR